MIKSLIKELIGPVLTEKVKTWRRNGRNKKRNKRIRNWVHANYEYDKQRFEVASTVYIKPYDKEN